MTPAPLSFAVSLLLGVALSAVHDGAVFAQTPPRTWNPSAKESPEPYGYDVYTAPDLPLGIVDPNDPPAVLTIAAPADPRLAALGVVTNVDRTSYTWYGTILVTADVLSDGFPAADCDSVVVISAANPRVRAHLADDGAAPDATAGDGRYSGFFEIGAGEGEARPTGSYSVTATAHRAVDIGSDASPAFSLYSVRRWTGITTGALPDVSDDYTAFFVTSNGPGAGYHHEIRDVGLVRSTSVTNAQIRIPILPLANEISGVTVSGSGVSNVTVIDNVIAFDCDLSSSTVKRVTIEFDAPSDLAASRIDRYQTGDIGLRDFRNGYMIWNRYISTAILGSGFSSPHGPGCIVDLHATDLVNGDSHTLDCMERVAVHLDNAADNDGTGSYQSNIKWGGDALSWLTSAELGSLVFDFVSGGNYGLQDQVAVERRVEFSAESRAFEHRYVVRNIDDVSHDFDFVWGREQWLYSSAPGSDRQEDDRGLLPNDPASYGGEHRFTPAQIDGNWFAAFDQTSFYSIGVIFPEETEDAMPAYAHLLCDPALGNFTGEYPINPSGSCSDMPNLFFEKRFGVLAPGAEASYTFHMWGGYGLDRQELTDLIWQDADAIAGGVVAVDETEGGVSLGLRARPMLTSTTPNPFTSSVRIGFELPAAARARLTIYDARGRLVVDLVDDILSAGHHTADWSAATNSTTPLPSGVYFVRLEANGEHASRKLLVRR